MSESVSDAVGALRAAADVLGDAAAGLPATDPGPSAFGAGGPGLLGDVGRDLYVHWQRALDARAREAAAAGSHVRELADLASRAAGGLRDVDETARRGQPEVS